MERPPFGGRTLGMLKESMRRTCHGKIEKYFKKKYLS
jgi:hypothetical protein